jgi:uncharacterized oligopeptide transporter (OPT) family protein
VIPALLLGTVLGAMGALSNLHVSLKTGWSLPIMTSAALVSVSLARAVRLRGSVTTAMASAACYMAGGGNIAALMAFVALGGTRPSAAWVVIFWIACAVAGTLLACMLAPSMRSDPSLVFPTATASAEILQAGGGSPSHSTRVLTASTVTGALFAVVRLASRAPATLALPGSLGGRSLASLTFGVDLSVVLLGAGAIMTPRAAFSTLLGGLLTYGVAAPLLLQHGLVAEASYSAFVGFMVWPGASLLVASALTELALSVPRLLRAGGTSIRGGRGLRVFLGVSLVVALLEVTVFGVRPFFALAALPISVAVAYVASRAMGETDVVPTKALSSIAQFGFGAAGAGIAGVAIAPNVTSAVALHAADTLGSLKMAAVAGIPERDIVIARILGCILGAAVVMAGYLLLVQDSTALPNAELPMPAVLVWRSVTEVVVRGVDGLSMAVRIAIAAAALLGIALSVLERVLPARWARWLPSAAGLGSGMVLSASNSLAIAIGSAARLLRPRDSVATASGLVAGESFIAISAQIVATLRRVV